MNSDANQLDLSQCFGIYPSLIYLIKSFFEVTRHKGQNLDGYNLSPRSNILPCMYY